MALANHRSTSLGVSLPGMYVRTIAHIPPKPKRDFLPSLKRYLVQVVLCLRSRRLSLTVPGHRVENPDLLSNHFHDRPLLPIAILPTAALDPSLDEGVPTFG